MNTLPIALIIKQRWLNFFISGLNHTNSSIADFFNNSLLSCTSYSVSNLNIIIGEIGIFYSEIFSLRRTDIKKKVLLKSDIGNWKTALLRELMETRDGIRVTSLSNEEVDDMINYICIMT